MSELNALVGDALREPLAAARARASAGARVVGYAGTAVPVEVILASDAHPIRLPAVANIDATDADRYLESGFSPESRSIAAQYLGGEFAFMDRVVFPRNNDSLQRLYYYICELQTRGLCPGPAPVIYELAALPRYSSIRYSRRATERLAAELGTGTANLRAAVDRRNRRRALLARARRYRAQGRDLPGSAMDRICRAADLCDADRFDDAFDRWLTAAAVRAAGARVVLVGNGAPDDRIHRVVEAAGAEVVAEFGDHPACFVRTDPVPDATIESISDHYQAWSPGSASLAERVSRLATLCADVRADGVIIWLLEQEDARIWDVPAQLDALAAARLPVLTLTRRTWLADDGALDEIGAFSRRLAGRR